MPETVYAASVAANPSAGHPDPVVNAANGSGSPDGVSTGNGNPNAAQGCTYALQTPAGGPAGSGTITVGIRAKAGPIAGAGLRMRLLQGGALVAGGQHDFDLSSTALTDYTFTVAGTGITDIAAVTIEVLPFHDPEAGIVVNWDALWLTGTFVPAAPTSSPGRPGTQGRFPLVQPIPLNVPNVDDEELLALLGAL